jgi:catechol 2,3-dioxygenase-like lactoylglutathione lyase family enzyme
MSISIAAIDHVSVLVTDLARSRHFYRDVLGLKEIAKPRTFDFKVLWFQFGEYQLHLLQKDLPDPISPRHFALRVLDMTSAREHFKRQGIQTRETTLIPHCDRFFVSDPDGNRIEIIQWLKPYDPKQSGALEFDGQ